VTSLTRWDPFSDMRTTMDRLFDEGFSRPWRLIPNSTEYEATFPVEVSETDDTLEVKASHQEKTEDKKRDYYRREIRYGSFHRSLSLPVSVDADKAEAKFENGILQLTLPKAEAIRPKQIKVDSGSNVIGGGTSS
jgi:HSP20 family protein